MISSALPSVIWQRLVDKGKNRKHQFAMRLKYIFAGTPSQGIDPRECEELRIGERGVIFSRIVQNSGESANADAITATRAVAHLTDNKAHHGYHENACGGKPSKTQLWRS